MLKVFLTLNNVRKTPSVFLQRKKIARYFINQSRYNHEGSEGGKNSWSNEESSNKSEERDFNAKAIMDLCLERFDDDLLYFPEILNKDEWIKLIDWGAKIEEAVHKIKYSEILSSNKIPNYVLDNLKSLNLFGKQIPKKYGGLELTNTENKYIQEILGVNPSIARMMAENEEMGIKALVKYGTEEQKEKYLPKLAKGESMISFAFMEQSSSLMDCKSYMGLEAIHCGDHFILKGRKKWVYNAKNADLFLVLGSELVGIENERLLMNTIFIVDKNTEGVRVTQPIEKCWFKGLDICEVVFDEVIVKNENVLGRYGKGFDLFQDIVKVQRTSIIAECTTILKRLFHEAVVKSKSNSFLGKPISSFQFCEYALGELACLSYAAESVTYYLAARADYYHNPDLTLEVYMAKIFVAELIQEALQIYFNLLGKHAYSKEPFIEELVQNSHYYSIIDDTGFDLKLFVISHAIQYCASELATSVKKLADPKNNPLEKFTHNIMLLAHSSDRGAPKLDLSLCVHRMVMLCADDLEYCVSRLKYSTSKTLHRFGNNVLSNDYDMIILCEMFVRTYALIACIARASRAGFLNLPDAKQEATLAIAFSCRTIEKVKNLSNLMGRNEEELNSYGEIGRKAINNKEYMVEHPLMRNF